MILRALGLWLLLLALAVLNGGARNAWIRPPTTRAALGVGCLWLGLTEAFEFGAGHYLFGKPREQFLADYDLSGRRIWIAVMVATLLAPLWAARVRGLESAGPPGR